MDGLLSTVTTTVGDLATNLTGLTGSVQPLVCGSLGVHCIALNGIHTV